MRAFLMYERGSALVELALVLTVLLTILVGVADFGRVFYMAMELTAAARAGAQYGGQNSATAGDTNGMQTHAVAAAPDLVGLSVADISAGQACQCASDDGLSFSSVSCAGTCATGKHMVIYVTVTASKSFNLILGYLPSIPRTLPLSESATQRAK